MEKFGEIAPHGERPRRCVLKQGCRYRPAAVPGRRVHHHLYFERWACRAAVLMVTMHGLFERLTVMWMGLAYHWRTMLVAALLILYPYLALFGPYKGRTEFYPFANWTLFPRAQNTASDVVLLVKSIDGRLLPTPTLFFDLDDRFAAARRKDVTLAKLLATFVRAETAGDTARRERLLHVVRTRYLTEAETVAFDIARIRFDPVERYRGGAIMKTEILHSSEATP